MTTTQTEPRTPAEQLDEIEQQASEEIQAIIAGAVAAGISAAAIGALLAALTNAVSRAAQAGFAVGVQIALFGSGPRRARERQLVIEPLPTSVEDDVRAVVEDIARRIEQAARQETDTTSKLKVEMEQARRRLARLAVTKIHQSATAATFSYARWLGLDLEWVTRRDGQACPVCTIMNGRRAAAGERFEVPRGPGIPRQLWAGFQGLPPAHPWCRCRVLPRTPRPRQEQT